MPGASGRGDCHGRSLFLGGGARGGCRGLEGLDGDHGSAAGRAGIGEHRRLIGIGDGLGPAPWCWDAEQLAGTGDVLGASGVGEEAIVADAVEALGQDVDEEAADELGYRQGHGLVQITVFGAGVLPFEDDALVVEGDQAAV